MTAAAIVCKNIREGHPRQHRPVSRPVNQPPVESRRVPTSKVTLRDVAALARVHPATVSRFLNESTRHLVNAETAARVAHAVTELRYERNDLARGLRTRRSQTIGVVLPDLTNPLFPPMVRGLADALNEVGYTTLLANTDGDGGRARRAFETLRARQVDGFVLATAALEDDLVDAIEQTELPLVLINRTVSRPGICAVVPDDRAGIRAAVEHLVALGHRRIVHLAGPRAVSSGLLRQQEFRHAMRAAGLRAEVRGARAFTEDAGIEPAKALLSASPRPTAIVAANDLLALACYRVARELGLRCPDDLSIVGFNDMPFADRFDPPLTSVHVPKYAIGQRAAELLLAVLSGELREARTVLVAVELVVRRSSGPAPAG